MQTHCVIYLGDFVYSDKLLFCFVLLLNLVNSFDNFINILVYENKMLIIQ